MLRRPILICLPLLLAGMLCALSSVPGQPPHAGNPNPPGRPERRTGTRLPADLKQIASRVNSHAQVALAADHQARDAFNKAHPNVLPGLKLAVRAQPATYAAKDRFDWREQGKVPPIRNQGACETCWAFAAVGALECSNLIRNNRTIRGSEQQLVDCSNAGSCAHGGFYEKSFDFFIKRGNCSGQAYPYRTADGACNLNVVSPYKAVAWGFVHPGGGQPSVQEIKTAICQHGPVAATIYANTKKFLDWTGDGVFDEHADNQPVDHAILLVGWDDNKRGKNGQGSWILRNSWDTNWGNNGYAYVEYGCNSVGHAAAWVEAENVHYDITTLLVNDYRVKQGQEITVPIYLRTPDNVKSLGWTLSFGTNVVALGQPKVTKGNVTDFIRDKDEGNGRLKFGFTAAEGIKRDGTVAVLRFKATGAPGSRTPLTLTLHEARNPSHKDIHVRLIHGSIEIAKDANVIPKGSCSGNVVLTYQDVFCALDVFVGNLAPEQNYLYMDMNNDRHVTPDDASMILETVLRQMAGRR